MFYLIVSCICIGIISHKIVLRISEHFDANKNVLRIDRSDPEKDIYRLEISDKTMSLLPYKKHITLTIDNNADLSQD